MFIKKLSVIYKYLLNITWINAQFLSILNTNFMFWYHILYGVIRFILAH